jgi:shikimate dehydrogenase
MTSLFALIGNPVGHSRSPFIMNRAFAAAGMDAHYIALPVPEGQLGAAVDGLALMRAGGANVTYPYKEAVVEHLDRVAGEAERIGAVNTLVCGEDGVSGHNTDAPGTAIAFERLGGVSLVDKEVFIFGAGGSARAAAWGVLSAGAKGVAFAVRSPEDATRRIAALREWFRTPIECVRTDDRVSFEIADVVINATPVGMRDGGKTLIADESWIRPDQCFFDFVYHPRRTAFLDAAERRGAKTIDGLALLVSQASVSFHLWTGEEFDVGDMAAALDTFESGEQV